MRELAAQLTCEDLALCRPLLAAHCQVCAPKMDVLVVYCPSQFLFNKTNKTREFPKFYFVQKSLHVSGISFAHHQEFSTLHSTVVYFLQM